MERVYTTYYETGSPYITELRGNGKRYCGTRVYDIQGNLICHLSYEPDYCADSASLSIEYLQNKQVHNDYGPAMIQWGYTGHVRKILYKQNNKLHNIDHPANIEWKNKRDINGAIYDTMQLSTVIYCRNDLQHNTNGPSYIEINDLANITMRVIYKQNGIRHNANGPAIVYCYDWRNELQYYQNGIRQ